MTLTNDDLQAIRQIVTEQTDDIRLDITEMRHDIRLLKDDQSQQAMAIKIIQSDVRQLKQGVRRLTLQYEDLNERFKLAHI